VIVASETSPSVSVSVSSPAEKLRSVIGHRNINRPMESPPIRPTRNVDNVDIEERNSRTEVWFHQSRRRHLTAACRPIPDGHCRGFLFAAPTIAATHSSISAYSSASLLTNVSAAI
jgi:hypothetical protein